MSQDFDYSAPDVNNQYQQDISEINNNLVALMTAHSGNTQPSGLSSGAFWLDTSNVPYTLKQLDSNGDWIDQALLTDRGRDVDNARGTRDTLDQRISESLNDDGSLKTNVSANISEFIDFAESGTNAVDNNTFEVDGDHADLFYPDNEKGRIAKIEQPNEPTTYAPVEDASYNGGTNKTTVNLISGELTSTLKSGIAIDDIHYGTVGPSDEGGLPYIHNDKIFLGDGTETDSGIRLGAYNLPYDDSNVGFSASTTQEGIDNLENSLVNYLDPDGLVISNNSTDSDHDIDVDGGRVWVNDDSGGNFSSDSSSGQLVTLADESPAFQIDITGDNGLINNSSLSADTWYELGIIADSSGSNSPSVVGYTDANRPTASADLPSGYDLFRAMGTPGKTWWVRTDGSSNILSFNHQSDGWYLWSDSALTNFSTLLFEPNPTTHSNQTLVISNVAPPTKQTVNYLGEIDASGGQAHIGYSHQSLSSPSNGEAGIRIQDSGHTASQITVSAITGQTINWYANSNVSEVTIRRLTAFKAVG